MATFKQQTSSTKVTKSINAIIRGREQAKLEIKYYINKIVTDKN